MMSTHENSEPCSARKVAVFEPEDIRMRMHAERKELQLIEFIPNRGYVYSTGRLEWAIESGYDVYVVTPQMESRDEDRWWIELLPSRDDCLYFGSSEKDAKALGVTSIVSHWFRLFRKLGFPTEGLHVVGDFKDYLRDQGVILAEDIHI